MKNNNYAKSKCQVLSEAKTVGTLLLLYSYIFFVS